MPNGMMVNGRINTCWHPLARWHKLQARQPSFCGQQVCCYPKPYPTLNTESIVGFNCLHRWDKCVLLDRHQLVAASHSSYERRMRPHPCR